MASCHISGRQDARLFGFFDFGLQMPSARLNFALDQLSMMPAVRVFDKMMSAVRYRPKLEVTKIGTLPRMWRAWQDDEKRLYFWDSLHHMTDMCE